MHPSWKAAPWEPLEEQLGGRLNINHTFYAMNRATYGGFAARGWVYHSPDALLVMGARFQPKKALYIAALQGDREQGLAWALAEARRRGVPRITAHFPVEDSQSQAFYQAHGFAVDPSDDVVMEGAF